MASLLQTTSSQPLEQPHSSDARIASIQAHMLASTPIMIPLRVSHTSASAVQASPTASPIAGSPFSLPGTPGISAAAHSPPPPVSPTGVLYEIPVPVSEADSHLVIRRARISDFRKGHCMLLGQLTKVGEMDEEKYTQRMKQLLGLCDTYHMLVIEDLHSETIIATATLLVEWKLVHSAGAAGHIEDVVVKDGYRGKNLGLKVVAALHDVARQKGCYKVMLGQLSDEINAVKCIHD